MKKIIITLVVGIVGASCQAQNIDRIITSTEVERIEKTLSSDEMGGRKVFTPSIDKAASFLGDEMKTIGLATLPGSSGYLQTFSIWTPKFTSAVGTIDGVGLSSDNMIAFTTQTSLSLNEKSSYRVVRIAPGENFNKAVYPLTQAKENLLVLLDTSFGRYFNALKRFKSAKFTSPFSQVFVLGSYDAKAFTIDIRYEQKEQKLANVVGMIPGESKKNEYVVFSGHYDHLGIGKANDKGDSLYNGANDDASGTTAVLMLAKYYKAVKNNERTLVFVAFTAEEVGGFGSTYFSQQMDPDKVSAMFNIEMIGTDSKWGNNSAYITGYEKTDFGTILEKNLTGSVFKFYPDPYTEQNLFYRSDNATLARLGVPAHTISTSKMDSEPHYHKADDEISTLDMANMTEIIKSIALSATSIVAGKDTPSRVKKEDLK